VGPPRGPKHVSDIGAVLPQAAPLGTGSEPGTSTQHTPLQNLEVSHAVTEVQTHRGARLLPLGPTDNTGSPSPWTRREPAQERRMKESASCRLGPQISFRHEPEPQTKLWRFFRSEVRSNSNQIASHGSLTSTPNAANIYRNRSSPLYPSSARVFFVSVGYPSSGQRVESDP
jgi:hypothetical protein